MSEPVTNPGRRPYDTEKVLATVRENAKGQRTPECKYNYLQSCMNHGGELAAIAIQVEKELNDFK